MPSSLFLVFCHLEIESAPVVLVVDDHTVIDHAQSQNVVLGLERVLDHVALAQHHVQHHHLNIRIKGTVQRDRSGRNRSSLKREAQWLFRKFRLPPHLMRALERFRAILYSNLLLGT